MRSPRSEEIQRILKARSSRAEEASVCHAHPITRSLRDLFLTTSMGVPLLPETHPYDWLALDGASASGIFVVVSFGTMANQGPDQVTVVPGVPVWIRGKSVFVWGMPVGGNPSDTEAASLSGHVIFWATSGPVPPQTAPRLVDGSVAYREEWHGDLAAGSTQEIINSSLLEHAVGLPLSLKISTRGGQMTTLNDFPGELTLYEYDDDGSPVGHPRTWLFAADAEQHIMAPLARHRCRLSTDSSRWRLIARNPTGSAAAKTNMSVLVEVIVGTLHERESSRFGGVFAGTVKDVVYASAGITLPSGCATYTGRCTVANNAGGGGDLRFRVSDYVPESHGGPQIITHGATFDTAFGATGTAIINVASPWQIIRACWVTSDPILGAGSLDFACAAVFPRGGD